MAFDITRSKSLVARSLQSRAAAILCWVLLLTPLANVAFADTNSAIDKVLVDAISQTQDLMVSMSQGCSGGSNGVPPVNWSTLQPHGNSAVNALNAARLAVAKGQNLNAVQQINSAEGELDALVNGAHMNCSGGPHGEDPVYYNRYQSIRDTVKGKLDVLKLFLG